MLQRIVSQPSGRSVRRRRWLSTARQALAALVLGSNPAPAATSAPPNQDPVVVEPPQALETLVPYPEGATDQAEVTLELAIREDGSVAEAEVLEGDEPFASQARQAAAGWRFTPARRQGRRVPALIRFSVRFTPPSPPSQDAASAPASPPALPAAPRPEPAAGGATGASSSDSSTASNDTTSSSDDHAVLVAGSARAPGAAVITREEARALPGAFGDPLRAMEALPGVTPTMSGVPYFFVRGAPPANVGFFVDGVDVPLLYHAYFGPSVLQPGLLEGATLYSGAPPARYGRSAGAVMAVGTRGLRHQANGEASLRVIDAGGLVEVPFSGTDGSVLFGGRYSYTGLILSLLSDIELKYWDYQTLASYRTSAKNTLSLFAFGAYDLVHTSSNELSSQLGGESQFHRVDLRWDSRPSPRTATRLALTLGLDRSSQPGASTYADDRSLRARSEIRHQASAGTVLEFGADARVDDYNLLVEPSRRDINELKTLFPARTESTLGVYFGLELHATPAILLLPGIRSDLYTSQGASRVGVDPRMLATFRLSRSVSIEQTLGLSHQRPNFVPQVPAGQVAGLTGGLQRALNYSSGVRWKLPEDISASLTLFRSVYFNAVDPVGGTRDLNLDQSALDRRWTISSHGLELMLRRSLSRDLGGFLAYTLSRTEHTMGSFESVTGLDRTHVLQAALGYDFGRQWRAGVRTACYSGIPALVVGLEPPRFTDQIRSPLFLRLDVRVEKRWRWGSSGFWGLVGEVLNATGSKEVLRLECGRDCSSEATGPVVLPSVGLEAGY